ncbi:MAG TPA: flavin reductase family protein [Pseudothermotoga sp.]|nr:flavin reductase family protein [Pseudothermotoga sp.]HOK84118.1 flavin reductase family protein [Pseudothermotoga sp.]HPP69117.1 flavin reductase family protein [Pseudothermotoga sp.]
MKSVFDYLVQGVYIVSTEFENQMAGLTAAWVMQSSFKPPMLAVSLGPTRRTAELIEKSGKFTVQVLDEIQRQVAEIFGYHSSRNFDKFSRVQWSRSEKLGLPIIEGVLGYFECELEGRLESGDHVIYNGKIINHKLLKKDGRPMRFLMRDWF